MPCETNGMKKLLPCLLLILGLTACHGGMGFATKVRNQSGRTIAVAGGIDGNSAADATTIRSGGAGICSGVVSKPGQQVTWAISDGQMRYIYNDVSLIGTLHDSSATYSRFTGSFPHNRVTRHVMVDTNMSIHAITFDGSVAHQPSGFPIHYSTKESLLVK